MSLTNDILDDSFEYDEDFDDFENALNIAKQSDIIVVTLGVLKKISQCFHFVFKCIDSFHFIFM